MKQIIRNIYPDFYIIPAICIIGLVYFIFAKSVPDDPPNQKKEKKDTTEINVQQMRDINKKMELENKRWDSLIMKLDTLKKK